MSDYESGDDLNSLGGGTLDSSNVHTQTMVETHRGKFSTDYNNALTTFAGKSHRPPEENALSSLKKSMELPSISEAARKKQYLTDVLRSHDIERKLLISYHNQYANVCREPTISEDCYHEKISNGEHPRKQNTNGMTYGSVIEALLYNSCDFDPKWQKIDQSNFQHLQKLLNWDDESLENMPFIKESGNTIHNAYLLFMDVVNKYMRNRVLVSPTDDPYFKPECLVLGNQGKGKSTSLHDDGQQVIFLDANLDEEHLIQEENSLMKNLQMFLYNVLTNYSYKLFNFDLVEEGEEDFLEPEFEVIKTPLRRSNNNAAEKSTKDSEFEKVEQELSKEDKKILKKRKKNLSELKSHFQSFTRLMEYNILEPIDDTYRGINFQSGKDFKRAMLETKEMSKVALYRFQNIKRYSNAFVRFLYMYGTMRICYRNNITRADIRDNIFIIGKNEFPFIQCDINRGKKQNVKMSIDKLLLNLLKLHGIDVEKLYEQEHKEERFSVIHPLNFVGLDVDKETVVRKRGRKRKIQDEKDSEHNSAVSKQKRKNKTDNSGNFYINSSGDSVSNDMEKNFDDDDDDSDKSLTGVDNDYDSETEKSQTEKTYL